VQADWALGTRQATGEHTDAGGQCADTTEAGVGADGPARALDTRQAMGEHTDAGGQRADTIEAGIGVDGPARIYTGTGSGGLGD